MAVASRARRFDRSECLENSKRSECSDSRGAEIRLSGSAKSQPAAAVFRPWQAGTPEQRQLHPPRVL